VSGGAHRLWRAVTRCWQWLGPPEDARVPSIPGGGTAGRPGPMQLELGWSNPVSVAAAWAVAKAAGGTLDYRLRSDEDIVFEIQWVARNRARQILTEIPIAMHYDEAVSVLEGILDAFAAEVIGDVGGEQAIIGGCNAAITAAMPELGPWPDSLPARLGKLIEQYQAARAECDRLRSLERRMLESLELWRGVRDASSRR